MTRPDPTPASAGTTDLREARPRSARAWLAHLRLLSDSATAGEWYHYDEVFRAQFSRRRATEIQRAKDGKAIVCWGGFDGLDPQLEKKRNHNARFIVALVNAFRSGWFSDFLSERAAAESRLATLAAENEALRKVIDAGRAEAAFAYADEIEGSATGVSRRVRLTSIRDALNGVGDIEARKALGLLVETIDAEPLTPGGTHADPA